MKGAKKSGYGKYLFLLFNCKCNYQETCISNNDSFFCVT
jgi:hypothetical protein